MKSSDWYAPRRTRVCRQLRSSFATYDDIHGLVEIDNLALIIDDRHGTDAELGEHVNNVEHGRLHRSRGNVSKRLLRRRVLDVSTDAQLANAEVEVLCDVAALLVSLGV